MTPLVVTMESRRLLRGCTAGLAERTALVEVSLSGGLIDDRESDHSAVVARIRDAALALHPVDAPFLIAGNHWPTEFLLPGAGPSPRLEGAEGIPERWLGDWVIAVAVAVQRWARDPVFRGRVVAAEPGRLTMAIPWQRERLFCDALDLALRLVVLAEATDRDQSALAELQRYLRSGLESVQAYGLPTDTLQLVCAAVRRDIPFEVLPGRVHLGWGVNAESVDGSFTARTSVIATGMARNNLKTSQALADAGLPVPAGQVVNDLEQAIGIAGNLGGQVVIKPLYRGEGVGAIPGISDADALRRAFEAASGISPGAVLVERHIPGVSYQMLVVRGHLLAVARRSRPGEIGDTAVDVVTEVHPDNRRLAERAARIVGLDIADVDFITPDPRRSWRQVDAAVCGVNAQPAVRVHRSADPSRDIDGEVLDILFTGRPARIPTAAITGTNGKTTTSTMLQHIWKTSGKLVGACTSTQLRIGDDVISTDNLAGYPGARIVLHDPGVEAAVFEIPRKGLIIFGHPCDHYDVAALLNVQDDHIGVDGIETLEQMAELKAQVLERARHAIVVNADDPLCLAMRSRSGADRHVLVADDPVNAAVREHRSAGGDAVFVGLREGRQWIVLAAGEAEIPLMPVDAVPATRNGLLRFNMKNAMFAAAMAWAQGIDQDAIRLGLGSFHSSVDQNPGRYNFIEGLPFEVLLDFAHNPDGIREVCSITAGLPVEGRRLLCIVTTGSRHPAHFAEVAPLLAESFDEFVLGCNPRDAAKQPEYAGDDPSQVMLARNRRLLEDHGVAPRRILTEVNRQNAVRLTLGLARPGDLVVLLAQDWEAIPVIREFGGQSPAAPI